MNEPLDRENIAMCPLAGCGWHFHAKTKDLALKAEKIHWKDYHA